MGVWVAVEVGFTDPRMTAGAGCSTPFSNAERSKEQSAAFDFEVNSSSYAAGE